MCKVAFRSPCEPRLSGPWAGPKSIQVGLSFGGNWWKLWFKMARVLSFGASSGILLFLFFFLRLLAQKHLLFWSVYVNNPTGYHCIDWIWLGDMGSISHGPSYLVGPIGHMQQPADDGDAQQGELPPPSRGKLGEQGSYGLVAIPRCSYGAFYPLVGWMKGSKWLFNQQEPNVRKALRPCLT